jgi:hypothetical protein
VDTERPPSAKPDAKAIASRSSPLADDLLRGAAAIAEFMLGDKAERKKVYHWAELPPGVKPPIFRIGSILCARPSRLIAWIAEQEAAVTSPLAQSYPSDKPSPRAVIRHRRNHHAAR